MPITPTQVAQIDALLRGAQSEHSLRFLAASIAVTALAVSGAAERHGPAKVAQVAWNIADAFLEETVTRLLPNGIK